MSTETRTTTLTEFLLARIAEDKAAARAERYATFGMRGAFDSMDDGTVGPYMTVDPARVLAECEAKRAIVGTGEFPTWPMRILATVYSDHPDYREEWRP